MGVWNCPQIFLWSCAFFIPRGEYSWGGSKCSGGAIRGGFSSSLKFVPYVNFLNGFALIGDALQVKGFG